METYKIKLLENFGLISKIMPYYGPTHKSFLLLSALWVKSRKKLNEYFNEFKKIMLKYWAEIKFTSHTYSTFPPWDLF